MVHQLCNICVKLGSCFSGSLDCPVQSSIFFCDKAQAGRQDTAVQSFIFFCDKAQAGRQDTAFPWILVVYVASPFFRCLHSKWRKGIFTRLYKSTRSYCFHWHGRRHWHGCLYHTLKLYVQVFYVMGNALLGQLYCTWTDLVVPTWPHFRKVSLFMGGNRKWQKLLYYWNIMTKNCLFRLETHI